MRKINGRTVHKSVTLSRIMRAVEESMSDTTNPGLCIACGEDADGCEPDARCYECDACGERAVYGAEELLLLLA